LKKYTIFRELIAVCSENYTKYITGLQWKFFKHLLTVELQRFVGYILLCIFIESFIIITNKFITYIYIYTYDFSPEKCTHKAVL